MPVSGLRQLSELKAQSSVVSFLGEFEYQKASSRETRNRASLVQKTLTAGPPK